VARRSAGREKSSPRTSGLVILAVLVIMGLWIKSFFHSTENPKTANQLRYERLEKEPLRVTEASSLGHDFRTYFCTNKYVYWNSSAHTDTDIQFSYVIETKDGKYISSNGVNLMPGINFSGSVSRNIYPRTDEDSSWCSSVSLYQELKNMPYLQYQKGYNIKTQSAMHKKEEEEREQFYNSIKHVTFSFKDRKAGTELLSFEIKHQ